tara:strand:- start:507 stop:1061 length:555 start_codon:yes stop_codon:yes gene_type:complete
MKPKSKKCKICGEKFSPFLSTVKVCSPKCALRLVRLDAKKKEAVAQKSLRKDTKRRREALKTVSDYAKEVQVLFNRYIRLRDDGNVCISCQKPPKKKNAGHYKTTKAFPELRYNVDNCHLQCEHCNTYLSGNITQYRIYLLEKIGAERLAKLEGKTELPHLRIDDYKELKIYWRDKIKEFEGKL